MAEADNPEAKADPVAFWEADEVEAQQMQSELGEEPAIPADQEKPAPVEEPAVEEPAVEEPAAPVEEPEVEAPAVEEPPLAAKPVEEAPVEDKRAKDANYAWQQLRRLRREQKEAEAAAAAKPAPVAPAAPALAEEEFIDPIERAERAAKEAQEIAKKAQEEVAKVREETAQQRQEREITDKIARQEAAFKATHPDYDEAMNFVIESRREQFDVMGKLDADADQWIAQRPDLVERHAQETGLNPDDYGDIRKAARDMAFRIAIHQERQQLIANCERTGRNVAESVYGLAKSLGRKDAAAAPETKPVVQPEVAAKERVAKAKVAAEKRAPFSQKLAAMDTNPSPSPKQITTREELMRAPDKEQTAYLEKMDEENANFLENLDKWEG